MIARGFRPVGWVAGVGAAAICCYMVSLRVASERADLTSLERRIVLTHQQIRTLEAELGTRGRLQQLEQWNEDVLSLRAPAAGQFVAPEARLAQYSITQPAPLEGGAEVRMAAAPAPVAPAQATMIAPQRALAPRPAAPQPALQQPMMQRASLTLPATATPRPRNASGESATPARPRAATVRTASAAARTAPAPARPRVTPTRLASAEPRAAAPARAQPRPAAPPARRPSLIDERTLRDLSSAERGERRGTRRN